MLTHGWGKLQMVFAGVFAMGVAAFVAHGGDPWTGSFSIDAWIRQRRRGQ